MFISGHDHRRAAANAANGDGGVPRTFLGLAPSNRQVRVRRRTARHELATAGTAPPAY